MQRIRLKTFSKDLFQELTPESGEGSAESSIDLESGQITNVAIPDDVDEYIPDMTDIEEEADEDGSEGDKRRPKKRVKPYERKRCSNFEEEELKDLFKEDFKTLKLPGQKRIERVMALSLENNGLLHKRQRDTIKKKLSNMMKKIRGN